MRARTLALAALLTATLSACGSGGTASIPEPSGTANATIAATTPTASAEPSPTAAECKAATSTNKDLKSKPNYTGTDCPEPPETFSTDIVVGTGAEAKDGTPVQVQYLGVNYETGEEFDSSWARGQEPLPFTIGAGVIPGFSKGVTGMKEGGRRLVVIPPKDGYGDAGPVPGGTIAFVIDLVKVG